MTTNDCIKEIHAALVDKVAEKAEVDGSNKLAIEISGKIAEYGAEWATAFSGDGKLDAEEARRINAKFNAIIDTYLPSKDGIVVEKAWNGFTLCFVTVFKGVKAYLNQWFDLGL